jgi:hypothetical protein
VLTNCLCHSSCPRFFWECQIAWANCSLPFVNAGAVQHAFVALVLPAVLPVLIVAALA